MSRGCVRRMSRRSGCSAGRRSSTTWRRSTGCARSSRRGPAWFAGHGRNGRKGLRSFSVSGRVKKPGVHLAPAGITLQELIDEYCGGMLDGHTLYGYLPGGASGGILPASMANVPLDFDTLNQYGCFIGSAAVVVLSDKDTAAAAARNVMKFFADESCGQCTPCRVGTEKALHLMKERRWDQPLMQELSQAMMDASICGLGQAAPNPMLSVLKYFPTGSRVMHQGYSGSRQAWSRSPSTGRPSRRPRITTILADRRCSTASRSRASATWRACARTATAARAWSRSKASACSRRPAAAIRRTAWR